MIVVVAVGLLAYVPNLVLTRLTGLSRGGRVAIATTWFFLALGGLAYALRQLQGHREI